MVRIVRKAQNTCQLFLFSFSGCFASAAQSEKKEGGKELIKTDEDTAAASLFLLLLSFLSLLKTNSACDEGGPSPSPSSSSTR